MMDILIYSLVVYAITFIVVSSTILHSLRVWIIKHSMFLIMAKTHPLSCRMCAGWWITIIFCLIIGEYSIIKMLAIYGVSYFIATQERR